MKVLLTGGSGFLGSHIAHQLDDAGVSVRALVRRTSNTRFLEALGRVELAQGALDDPHSLRKASEGVTHVIHCAGAVKAKTPADFHRINAGGTVNLIDAVKRSAPDLERFVLVSSLTVCGPSKDGRPVPMDAEPNPVTHYGKSKLAAERTVLAEKNAIPSVILRPATVYGPRDSEVLAFFQAVKFGFLPLTGSPRQGISTIYASDCANACIQALSAEVPSGSTYCVEDGETLSLQELIAHIERAMNKRIRLRLKIPKAVLYGAALGSELVGKLTGKAMMLTRNKCNELLAPHWVCDATETQRDLKWEAAVPFAEGSALTAKWYQQEGWL